MLLQEVSILCLDPSHSLVIMEVGTRSRKGVLLLGVLPVDVVNVSHPLELRFVLLGDWLLLFLLVDLEHVGGGRPVLPLGLELLLLARGHVHRLARIRALDPLHLEIVGPGTGRDLGQSVHLLEDAPFVSVWEELRICGDGLRFFPLLLEGVEVEVFLGFGVADVVEVAHWHFVARVPEFIFYEL